MPLGHLQMYQHPNHRVPEGEEEVQEIENLFEKIMKENSPDLAKEIDIQVQEAESLKQFGTKEDHTKTCLLYTSDAADDC